MLCAQETFNTCEPDKTRDQNGTLKAGSKAEQPGALPVRCADG